MEKQFEGVLELFDTSVRRLANGNKLRLVFEVTEDKEMEKELIEFRGELVKATIKKSGDAKKDDPVIEGNFEVFDLSCRRLRNGDKLKLVLEQMYTKEKELDAVKLRYEDCSIFFQAVDKELDFDGDDAGYEA